MKNRYEDLLSRAERLGISPPPRVAYSKAYRALKGFIEVLLEKAEMAGSELPPEFQITGEWVTCVTHPDGKTLSIKGKDLKVGRRG
jgi:hypothetical protein